MISYREFKNFILQFVRLQKWTFFFIFFLDCFAWSLDVLLWPYILSIAIDIFIQYEGDRLAAWNALKPVIAGGLGLVFYIEIVSRTMGYLMAKASPKLQADIRMTMFDHVQQHSPHYFNERFAGSLANKITDMTTQVDVIVQQLFFPIVPMISACLLGAGFLYFVNPIFSAILLVWTLIHLGICIKFTRSVDAYEHEHAEARSTLLGRIVDSFTNNFSVNLFYRFKYERKNLAPFQNEEKEKGIRSKRYVEKMRFFLSVFYILGVIFAMFGTLLYLWLHNKISTGQVIQVFTTMWSLGMILWSVSSALPLFFQSCGVAKQAYSVMCEPPDLGDKLNANRLKVSSGEVVFQNVSFHYGEKKLFTEKNVKIQGGEKVGLVGFTGAGKSTFINLILRLFPLNNGKICIDGQDIAYVTLESLRNQIALIPQDPLLFHRTLKENIQFGSPDASDKKVLEAARLAHCEEFIRNIPGGYDARVGERGTKLSGGEKQRIAIARAILADRPILILDEATSALDSVTERCIQDSLKTVMEGRTTIVVAHRLSTLSSMDRLLVFEKGKIVEEGTHSALLAKEGLYAKMWKMQVGGFLPEAL